MKMMPQLLVDMIDYRTSTDPRTLGNEEKWEQKEMGQTNGVRKTDKKQTNAVLAKRLDSTSAEPEPILSIATLHRPKAGHRG